MSSLRIPGTGLVLWTVAAWSVLTLPGVVQAISNNLFVLPASPDGSPAYSPRHGLNLEIDDRWFEGAGYRPVRMRLTTATPSAVARRVDVRLAFSDSGRAGDEDLVVLQTIDLPAAAETVDIMVRCPVVVVWSSMAWEIKVDNHVDAAISSPGFVSTPSNAVGQGMMLRIVTPALLDAGGDGFQDERQVMSVGAGERRRQFAERLVCEPMTSWLDYSASDVVSVDLATLRRLAERPQEIAALRRWVVAGGVLWVESAGVAPRSFAEVESLLDVSRWRMTSTDEKIEEDEAIAAEASMPPAEEGAAPTPDSDERRERQGAVTPVPDAPGWVYVKLNATPGQDEGGDSFQTAILNSLITAGNAVDTRGWFAQRDAGFGRILAFNKLPLDVPAQLQFGRSRQIFGAWQNPRWASRHGLEPGSGSAEFGNLLIPGVGLAPVNAFQVLITLFVLVIGPLNYWLLWRRQQLHLLVVTTPLVALVATLGLAGYASVADGFGVKARAHSVTLLDQTTGEAATWGRVSHYVATTPEELPSVPSDTAIYPIEPVWEAAFADPDADLVVRWEGDRQVLRSGWTPSRTAVQHLLVRSHKTDKRLELSGQGDAIRVANRIGTPLELVVVRNDAGEWLMAENLDAEGAVVLKPVERLAAMQAFRTMAISRMPAFPAGAGRAVEDTLQRVGSGQREIRRMQRGMMNAALSENAQAKVLDALTGLDGGRSIDVPPKSYIAVASQTIDTPLGWDDVEELESFHVLVGRW